MSLTTFEENVKLEMNIKKMSEFLERLVFEGSEAVIGLSTVFRVPYFSNVIEVCPPSVINSDKIINYGQPIASGVNMVNQINQSYGHSLASFQNSLPNIKSVLSASVHETNSFRPLNPISCHRRRMWINYRLPKNDFDSSNMNVEATMLEEGLTKEDLTNSEVRQMFMMFLKLSYYITEDYISDKLIFEEKNIPNTLNVPNQIKHAIWSSLKLLRNLREILNRCSHSSHQTEYIECKESLDELQCAIWNFEKFKNCTMEHRKGKLIRCEDQEIIGSLMMALNDLIETVGKSKLHIEVLESTIIRESLAVTPSYVTRLEGVQPSVSSDCSYKQPASYRPQGARRYIG